MTFIEKKLHNPDMSLLISDLQVLEVLHFSVYTERQSAKLVKLTYILYTPWDMPKPYLPHTQKRQFRRKADKLVYLVVNTGRRVDVEGEVSLAFFDISISSPVLISPIVGNHLPI